MQIRHNRYNLGKSNNIEISLNDLDIKTDIKLNTNERKLNIDSSISGIVVDVFNNPIKNAIVKLINNNLEPIASTKTDENGKYVISVIPTSTSYTVLATAIEKMVNQSTSFTLKLGENKFISFKLSNDPNILFGAISGILTDSNNNVLKGAVILLYKEENNSKKLFAITYSDSQGTFLFSELLQGQYKILVQSLTNMPYEESIKVESRMIYNFNKSLNFNSNLSEGSISGFISDNLGNSIAQADVILYKVENNIKTPVAFTKTNAFGMYSFANVPFGSYLVKSNASQNLDLTNIISPSVKITSTSELGTYKFSTGILENGAILDSTGFINFLGGEKDGSVTLSITAEKYGLYTLAVYYVAADFNRALKVNINGRELDETYKVAITPGWEVSDSKIFEVLTSLNEGVNIIKFHGDGKSLAPKLSMVTLILNETENQTVFTTPFSFYNNIIFENISLAGVYSNGAKYDKETFLATALGGTNDGAVTVSTEITDFILYYMELKYVANSSNLTFKIDVNEASDNKVYTPPKTSKINTLEIGTFTLPIAFNKNINYLKFHGDKKNFSPDLDSFYLIVPPITQNLTEGIFENSVKLYTDKQFVLGIGGPKNGAVSVAVDVSVYGYYKIYIEYIATLTTLPLKIDVNGINNSTIIHLVPPTGEITTNNSKIFSTIIYLNSGLNTLRFYGNGKDLAPNLKSFKLAKTNIVNNNDNIKIIKDVYDVTEAKLSGSATLDNDKKFIIALGGKTNGVAIFNITVEYDGEYVLQTNYYYNNREFKIDINELSNNKVYKTIGQTMGIFKTTMNLKAGNNTLKFYGYYSYLAPNLSSLMINLNSPLHLRTSDFFLYNNAKILPSGIIKSIGGKNQGRIAIYYFAYEYAEYTLNILLSNDAKELLIKINNTSVISIKNIPTPNSSTIAYSKNIVLNYGDNFIEFLGNSDNNAPDIYSLEIKPTFPGPFIYTYSLDKDVLNNSAELDISTGFIKYIGTKDKGTALLIVQMELEGFYDLNIQYINPYNINTPLRLKVNNKFIENTYYIPVNESNYDGDKVKIFVIPRIQLNKSINLIEFSGNGIDSVAYLGKIRLSKSSNAVNVPIDEYYATGGNLENGAKIATFSRKFVDKLGGNKQQGAVTIKVNVEKEDFYELVVEYLVNTDNNNLLIEINENYTGVIYTLPKTDSLKEENSKNFIVPIFLNKGDNYIKFQGDKINIAPSLGKININKSPESTTYTFSNAILKNAELLNVPVGFITLNGSSNTSSASIKVKVSKTNSYYLTFKYLCKTYNSINIGVNTLSYGDKFTLEATKSENVFDARYFTIKVNLNKGENLVVFSKIKNSNDVPLLLHSFSISTNILVKNIALEKLFFFNGAIYDAFTGFISKIGGEQNGYVIMNIIVSQEGLYDLYINYLSLDHKRKLKFKINDSPIKNTYIFPSTGSIVHKSFIRTFSIPINLKVGSNKIKIYGNYNLEGPMISEITLSLNVENIAKIYYLSEGTSKGKAILDNVSKTVSNIGGKDKGEVTIKLNVLEGNLYNLQLQYKSVNSDSILFLDVSNISKNNTFKLVKTSAFFNKINMKIFLSTGDNFLRFYGDENNNNLILGNFTLSNYMNLLTLEKNTINFNVALGEIKNGANVYIDSLDNEAWVEKIGGKLNGYSTVTLNLDYDGEYALALTYYTALDDSKSPRTFTISINSVNLGMIFPCINDGKRIYEIILQLKKGVNKLKFAGDGKNESPHLSSATLTIKKIYGL